MEAKRTVKIPGLDHPISIEAHQGRVRVYVGAEVIADSHHALSLKEAAYSPVLYIPRKDVDMGFLERSEHMTYCPYKGECNYYSIPSGGPGAINAVWTYEDPFPAVAAIRGHLAFYPDRVDRILAET
jgi:uncharacterized protein (DUF427 family)